MSASAPAPTAQPMPGANGRISMSFDVIDAPSITYADAVHAVSQDSGSVLLPPPQWGHKGMARFLHSFSFRSPRS
jgi:hypothetical protein